VCVERGSGDVAVPGGTRTLADDTQHGKEKWRVGEDL
jgi:hypothetical protein